MPPFTVSRLLILVSLIIFVLAAFGVSLGSLALEPLGLAFLAASFLLT